jgi:hypothetical protein
MILVSSCGPEKKLSTWHSARPEQPLRCHNPERDGHCWSSNSWSSVVSGLRRSRSAHRCVRQGWVYLSSGCCCRSDSDTGDSGGESGRRSSGCSKAV